MEGLGAVANSGAELGLNEILIIVFVALVILALLIGYLFGRTMTNSEKRKADKKKARQKKEEAKITAKELRQKEKEEAQLAKEAEKEARKNKARRPSLEKEDPILWVEPDSPDDRPSSRPIIPPKKEESNIFIPAKTENSPHAAPVVARTKHSDKSSEQKPTPAPAKEEAPKPSKWEQRRLEKEQAKEQARLEKERIAKEKADAKAAAAKAKEDAKAEAAKAKAEKVQVKIAKQPEPAALAQSEPEAGPATPDEMAKRLEAILGTSAGPAVTLGAAEEELPAGELGKVELSVQPEESLLSDLPAPEPVVDLPAPEPDNWAVEETRRLNKEAEKKAKKEEKTPVFNFGAGVESSADDVQLSARQRKKLQKAQEEEARKAAEAKKAAEEKEKKKASIFGKKKEEEAKSEDEYWDENYMGEEIPDSLAGFGFTAAPSLDDEDEKG